MNSLFKDLGIFNLNSSNDPSLKQGLEYDRYQKDYLDASRYELLERSTTSGLSSVIESMSAVIPTIILIHSLLKVWKVLKI